MGKGEEEGGAEGEEGKIMAVRSMSCASSSGRCGAAQEKGMDQGMRRQVVWGTRQRTHVPAQRVVVSAHEKRSHSAAVTSASANDKDRLSRSTCSVHAAITRVRPAEM